jgi:Zn-finger nucleic acid-binding protein
MALKCPRDGSEMEEVRYEADIMVDVCRRCRGKWLDEGELEAIQESTERDYSKELAAMGDALPPRSEAVRPYATATLPCPKCSTPLVEEEYAHCSQIHIDVCPEGCGVWLDEGELKAVELFFEKNRERAASEDEALWVVRGFWASLRGKLKRG